MALTPGTRLGVYEITAQIGEGGMGQIYRARDTKLDRDVAIKILPEVFAHDADRLARFQREAKTLASVNHPNIAAIYGLEESGGYTALLMELVEGEDLSQRIARGVIPIDEALPIAKQIADALEAAHEQGIIHRDLKPANIKVRSDGTVKVLDFGLAKALDTTVASDPNVTQLPTITTPAMMTGIGVILGTAAYMSPEQAKGRAADKRSDVWAFGCVLYEMLTGKRAFEGEDVSETLAAVLRTEPDLTRVPVRVRRLLQACLQKDPMQRLQAIGDSRLLLVDSPERAPEPKSWLPWAVAAVAMLLAVSVTFGWWRTWGPTAPAHPVMRWTVDLRMAAEYPWLALSRDGSRLAYVGSSRQIYVRLLDQLEARPLVGTDGAWAPFLSPDGRWIGYFTRGKVKKVPVAGGASITLCDSPDTAPPSGTWGPDDGIIWSGGAQSGLSRVAASGGDVQVVLTPDRKNSEFMFYDPHYLPGGKGVLFSIAGSMYGGLGTTASDVAVLDLTTGEKKILQRGAHGARSVPDGHLVFMREATMFAAPFDLQRLQMRGTPVPVIEDIYVSELPAFDFSDTGTLLYARGGRQQFNNTLVWVDRNGKEQPLPTPPGGYQSVGISPDGARVVLVINGPASADVFIEDLERGTLSRLTFEAANSFPVWAPDGKRVAFVSGGSAKRGLFWMPFDGSSKPEQLLLASDDPMRLGSWTPDGKALVVTKTGPSNRYGLWVVPVAGTAAGKEAQLLLETHFNSFAPRVSPDGRWLAYYSTESGAPEVFVQPFPGLGGKWQISTGGGQTPVWAQSGRELFYLSPDGKLMAVEVETGARFRAGTPRALFQGRYEASSYDVAPDGKRFLMIKQPPPESGPIRQAVVVTEWFDELRRLAPLGK